MGHTLIGTLPRTRAWQEVVGLIAAGADVNQVANATIRAAEKAFSYVLDDVGYTEAVWFLTQLGLAAGSRDFFERLRSIDVVLQADTSLPDVIGAISNAIEKANFRHTDAGEIGRHALVGAVTDYLSPKLPSLYSPSHDDIERAFSALGSKKQFGAFARDFFAKFISVGLYHFLTRTLGSQIGEGQRFISMGQKSEFDEAMAVHCREASLIVEKFAEDWFSKHKRKGNGAISRQSSDGFASYALQKMRDELQAGIHPNAE